MNHTQVNNPNHNDSEDDLICLGYIFANALGNLLKETEGVVVELPKNVRNLLPNPNLKKVIVFNENGQIKVDECHEDLPNGHLVWMH
jgi:hypothetical protein